ncbi:hydroxyproline O-galactosyltransferase HPGT1-like [Triticum aestivum]|uniref:hydroxyproline O-galactosyltransferase HPGT1-like n=1 Tax=Triticum aestivum TaxID=4565 RepID=UPI001D00BB8D|nr:hydroxyproline O-galactosyltransferase HPGT1-like [Triticum aestivum]
MASGAGRSATARPMEITAGPGAHPLGKRVGQASGGAPPGATDVLDYYWALQDDHIESDEELPKKTKRYVANAAETFDAEFYAKFNDDIYINVDTLSAMLETHWDKPRVYIGCMKSGEVFSEATHKWYEPDWWKFGDGKS